MAGTPAPQDLSCPDPERCPVAPDLPAVKTVALAAGTALYRVYDSKWGYDEHNPGIGDARFSPIDDPVTGKRLPSMYLAATRTAASLETVFHDVHHQSGRTVYERDLLGKLLAHVQVPAVAALGDLRDPELDLSDNLNECVSRSWRTVLGGLVGPALTAVLQPRKRANTDGRPRSGPDRDERFPDPESVSHCGLTEPAVRHDRHRCLHQAIKGRAVAASICTEHLPLEAFNHAVWQADYNRERLHEALGYGPPAECRDALTGASHHWAKPTRPWEPIRKR